jgi:hypothetical protein
MCFPLPHPSAARMTWDGAFVSTGAAGKAQAVTDRNDPSTIPEKASPEVLVMVFLSPCMAAPIGCIQFNASFIESVSGTIRRQSEPSATSAHAEEGTSALRICVRPRRTRSTLTVAFVASRARNSLSDLPITERCRCSPPTRNQETRAARAQGCTCCGRLHTVDCQRKPKECQRARRSAIASA